jgi:hypothetical protein
MLFYDTTSNNIVVYGTISRQRPKYVQATIEPV